MELWQIKLRIEETPDVLLLLKWIEEQEIEDLRYLLSEMEKEHDDAELNADKRYDELMDAEKERDDALEKCDELQEKLDAVKAMLEEVDDMGCSLEYINEILNLLE